MNKNMPDYSNNRRATTLVDLPFTGSLIGVLNGGYRDRPGSGSEIYPAGTPVIIIHGVAKGLLLKFVCDGNGGGKYCIADNSEVSPPCDESYQLPDCGINDALGNCPEEISPTESQIQEERAKINCPANKPVNKQKQKPSREIPVYVDVE
jgi:hypothetical protein